MNVSRRLVASAAVGLTLLAALYALHWYQTRIARPALIQREVLGREIASYEDLLSYEGGGAYGQGLWRWTYHITDNKTWSQLCNVAAKRDNSCEFERSRKIPGQDIRDDISYSDGTLVVEETWF